MSIKCKFITMLTAHVPLNENEGKAVASTSSSIHRRRLGDNYSVVGEFSIILLLVELTL